MRKKNTIALIGIAAIMLSIVFTALPKAKTAKAAEYQPEPEIVGRMMLPATMTETALAMYHAEPIKLAKGIVPDAPEIVEEPEPEQQMTSLGYWDVTAYTWSGNRCANGEYPYEGLCAVNGLPFGTKIYIEDIGVLTVADRGGMKGQYDVDIYMDSEADCWQWGRQSLEIWIVEE